MLAAAARNDISQRLRIRVLAATVLNQHPRGAVARLYFIEFDVGTSQDTLET
jgi:hypothetical protein